MIFIERDNSYYLYPGYIFVSRGNYLIHTVLGSCISVCLWDSRKRFGGMNHYIYGFDRNNERNGKYGEVAIPYLIKLMQEQGSQLTDLRAHIVGGGQNSNLDSFIGTENVTLAEDLIAKAKIPILTKDVHGEFGRKVIFNSMSGEILIYKIKQVRKEDWYGDFLKKTQNIDI